MEINLRSIYECDSKLYYDVVEYDNTLVKMKNKILSVDELLDEQKVASPKRCDFCITDGILRCNPEISKLPIDRILLRKAISAADWYDNSPGENSIYKLFLEGLVNNYLVMSDDESDWDKSCGAVPFSDIKFSATTMTVYACIHSGDGIRNQMIVTHTDNVLEFKPMVIAVEGVKNSVSGCHDLKRSVIINNVEYSLWETDILTVYDEVLFSAGLVNQACCESNILKSAIQVCSDFIGGLTSYLGNDAVEWIGGGGSFRSDYGVYFISSLQPLSKRIRDVIEDTTLKEITTGKTAEDVEKAVVKELGYFSMDNRISRFATRIFVSVATADGDVAQRLKTAFQLKRQLEVRKFWLDMYQYRVRVNSFLSEKSLTPFNHPVLVGGNTKEYTKVKARYY